MLPKNLFTVTEGRYTSVLDPNHPSQIEKCIYHCLPGTPPPLLLSEYQINEVNLLPQIGGTDILRTPVFPWAFSFQRKHLEKASHLPLES